MEKIIPVFPLKLVVFPESVYPLHIFEERYKTLINSSIENDSEFGIVARIEGRMQKIGSIVAVRSVFKKYEDGRMDISVKALKRFSILETRKTTNGVIAARIENYADLSPFADDDYQLKLKEKFLNFIRKFELELNDAFWRNYEERSAKSYKIAEKAGLNLEQQQILLSYRSEEARIRFLFDHLNRFEQMLSEKIANRKLIIGDGYLDK
ncbi:MAG: LON peptidase substrate-binding domain-containing protein [Ignavibacteriaceae bacterium]